MKLRRATLACLVFATFAAMQQGQAQPARGQQDSGQQDSGQQDSGQQIGRPRATPPALERAPVEPRNGLLDAPAQQGSTTAISRREASDLAREAFEGRVLSVRLDGGQWRIRMDEDGTVFSVLVDARSGNVARDTE